MVIILDRRKVVQRLLIEKGVFSKEGFFRNGKGGKSRDEEKRWTVKALWILAFLFTFLCHASFSLAQRKESSLPQLRGIKQIRLDLRMADSGIGFKKEDFLNLVREMVNKKLPFLRISKRSKNILHVEYVMDLVVFGHGNYYYSGGLTLQLKRPVYLLDKRTYIKDAIVWEKGIIYNQGKNVFESVKKSLGVLIDQLANDLKKGKGIQGKAR